ncbi:MAG TPA: thioether cross-link-forming SCIFF peptide maturase [Clostridiales bacterium]|nr:thioether cross-link-forming SCIFF peptide maturase [Clostridiales bacterium]HQK73514.1 thioether cross-link-forming SCIFF peptide maturase [Clostridiales bacterium]
MVHTYQLNGYFIAVDTGSGAVHKLDECSFELLNLFKDGLPRRLPPVLPSNLTEKFERELLEEAFGELGSLSENGSLFAADDHSAFACSLKLSPVKSMCLNVAHACNLRCDYCFASQGDFGGGIKLMTAETASRAIDFMVKESGERHNLEVDFFGGEPLMNFDVVKNTVLYARSIEKTKQKNFRFTITTNGMLLDDEKISFINKEMSNVVLSIDGRKEVHDRFRTCADGSGSYERIMPLFQKLVRERGGKDYYVRGTFTRKNLDFSADVLHLYEAGFEQISIEPAVSAQVTDYSIDESCLPRIFDEYEILAREIIQIRRGGGHINYFHFMIEPDSEPCLLKRLRGCSCGNEYVAVTPEGDIYPCHQFVGIDSFVIGNISKDELNTALREKFATANVFSKERCSSCWAKYYCSGGCNANNYAFCGSITQPHPISCEMEKKRLECAFMIQAALMPADIQDG